MCVRGTHLLIARILTYSLPVIFVDFLSCTKFPWDSLSCLGVSFVECGEGELVGGVHTLVGGVVQVSRVLLEVEEEDKGREEVQEIERESQGEENAQMTIHMCTHRAVPRNHRCCHWRPRLALSSSHRFSTFKNFPLRVQFLILLSCCINSSSLFPVAILCTLLHRGKHII